MGKQKINTACIDCAFGVWAPTQPGQLPTQIGCSLGRIGQFKKNGVEIDDATDGEKNFYVIKDTFCNTCRNQTWVQLKAGKDLVKEVMKEVEFKCDIIICLKDETLEELKTTISSAVEQHLKPKMVVVLNHSSTIKSQEIIDELKPSCEDKNIPWKVTEIKNIPNDKGCHLIPFESTIRELIKKQLKHPWYAKFNAGQEIHSSFLWQLNRCWNKHLIQFSMLVDDFDNVVVVYRTRHLKYETYKIFKAKHEEEKCPHLIKRVKDLMQLPPSP